MSSPRDSQMDTLGTRLRLRVCLCVFITFVDYAYKNYTSPRSQRRAPATTTGLPASCNHDATCRTGDYNGAVSFMVCSAFV
ncbi:uncharacterized protein LOC108025203 isoform X2 [Drosophila biarmipes]|uniref:uncharacterized protein LOC108025203 isoform X2 n=1 Tax=Drosophila biarmipes TaxID=125945 RepID=UPI0007E5D303|nr:uncharacterized protein LOC108025203 isoform X2 [Drosophila biarmipes]